MARHNREAKGVDQHGDLWLISYQPDWLKRVKISRQLPGDRRRSTLTLFRNPARRAEDEPGKQIRTRIAAADGSVDIQLALEDRDGVVEELVLVTRTGARRSAESVRFVIQGGLAPPS